MPDVNSTELRSLAYFRQVVAPVLSGPLGRSFWTHMVHQAAHQYLAARHAAVAIGALYEQLGQSPRDSRVPFDSSFALRHYNRAIKSITALKAPNPSDLDTVLLVCILFACIEFLQGGIESALQHCRHGTRILNFHTPKPELLPILRHLSIFPLLFTKKLPDHLPSADQCPAAPESFQSVAEAQEALDVLTYRLVGLSRVRDHYSASSASSSRHLAPLITEQQRVIRDLDAWQSAMTKLRSRKPIPQAHETIDRILQARWTTGITWATACLDNGECVYDAYMDRFERVIELASHAVPTTGSPSLKTPKFTFEMGFASAVYFVAIKCRHLPLRLKALSMLGTVSCLKETMWDRNDMKMVAQGIIEQEHDIKLTPEKIEEIMVMRECPPMPAEDRRIGDSGQGEDAGQGVGETESATKMIFHLSVS